MADCRSWDVGMTAGSRSGDKLLARRDASVVIQKLSAFGRRCIPSGRACRRPTLRGQGFGKVVSL